MDRIKHINSVVAKWDSDIQNLFIIGMILI